VGGREGGREEAYLDYFFKKKQVSHLPRSLLHFPDEADRDQDGVINEEEFFRVMRKRGNAPLDVSPKEGGREGGRESRVWVADSENSSERKGEKYQRSYFVSFENNYDSSFSIPSPSSPSLSLTITQDIDSDDEY